jgi:hypothetical protein
MENQEANVPVGGDRLQAAIEAMTEASTEAEAPQEEAVEVQEGNGVPLDDDQPITPGEENVEAAEVASEPPEPVEAESSKLASLARRERRSREQSKEREDKIVAREKDLEERLQKAQELEERIGSLKENFKYDPVRALRELGIEEGYSDVAGALYDEELGAEAPAANRQGREIRELQDKLKKFEEQQVTAEKKNKEDLQQEQTLAFQKKYVGDMESFMEADTTSLSYADAFYNNNPQEAIEAMYNIAYNSAVEDPSAILPTPQELAEALNQNLETTLAPVIDKILAARNKTTEVETLGEEEPIAATGTKTLRNAQSRRTQKQAPAKTEEERVRRALQMLSAG